MTEANLRERATISLLKAMPRNWFSRSVGKVAQTKLPFGLSKVAVKTFGKAVGVDFSEVNDPLSSFASVQEFFVRELRPGVRPIDTAEDAVVSPCDGAWGMSGVIDEGTLLQVKGRPYRAADLLNDTEMALHFDGGNFATFYLSPKDYHRFHTPLPGRIVRADSVPGTLWPVNNAGVALVDSLFAQNERLIAYLSLDEKSDIPDIAMVAVGATCVGKVLVTFDDLTTNIGSGCRVERYGESGPLFEKGAEWGRFLFGSTIVMLTRKGVLDIDFQAPYTMLRLGTRIGTLLR